MAGARRSLRPRRILRGPAARVRADPRSPPRDARAERSRPLPHSRDRDPHRRRGRRPTRGSLRPEFGRRPLRAVLDPGLLGRAPSADAPVREARLASALRSRLGSRSLGVRRTRGPPRAPRPPRHVPDVRIARLLRAPRAVGRCGGALPGLRHRGPGAGPLAAAGALAPRLPQCAAPSRDASRPAPARVAFRQRDRREDFRVARPGPALLRLDPVARLPGRARPVADRRSRDARRDARGWLADVAAALVDPRLRESE